MIISGQMTREEAILKLKEPLYEEAEMERDIAFVLKSINMSQEEFEKIMAKRGKIIMITLYLHYHVFPA